MGRFILKITDEKEKKDYYLEWSTVVDAPVTYGMQLKEFKKYYKNEYGEQGMRNFPERLERIKKSGSSGHYPYDNLADFFDFNRAGEKGTTLDKEGLLDHYCRNR